MPRSLHEQVADRFRAQEGCLEGWLPNRARKLLHDRGSSGQQVAAPRVTSDGGGARQDLPFDREAGMTIEYVEYRVELLALVAGAVSEHRNRPEDLAR